MKRDIRKLPFVREFLSYNSHPRYRMALKELEMEVEHGEIFNLLEDDFPVHELKKYLDDNYGSSSETIMYLPTYRRIEKGLQQLIKNTNVVEEFEVEDSNSLINFGMKDTDDMINNLLNNISKSFLEAYAQLSEDMLKELLRANDNEIEEIKDLNLDVVALVLQRVGNKISNSDKNRIFNIVQANKTNQQNYPILSMIKNLVEIYESSTKELEYRLEVFASVCNKYLVEKQFIYNKNNVTLEIQNNYTGSPINIDSLSSGEKQIVSLFAKLYLKEEKSFMMFFDEPELSLSIEWQRMLLNDILGTGNCKFLFVTTHSPFIFEDDYLLENTYDIMDCTKINSSYMNDERLVYE